MSDMKQMTTVEQTQLIEMLRKINDAGRDRHPEFSAAMDEMLLDFQPVISDMTQ
jgi:hypothetical protein